MVPSADVDRRPTRCRASAGRRSTSSVSGSSRVMSRPAAIWRTTLPQAMVRMPGSQSIGLVVHRLAEAEDVAHHDRLVVRRVVGDLHGPAPRRSAATGWSATSGSTSLAKPGSMPLTCRLAPVRRRRRPPAGRASRGGRIFSGHCSSTGPLETTLMPASTNAEEVLDALEDPVVGHRGVHDRVRRQRDQRVAVGGGGDAELAAEVGQLARRPCRPCRGWTPRRPTSSRSGWASMPAIACRPTVPVDQTTTRSGLRTSVGPGHAGQSRTRSNFCGRGTVDRASVITGHRVPE